MNRWNRMRRCLVAVVVAIGVLVVPRAASAIPDHCCKSNGDCLTLTGGANCGNYHCSGICGALPCSDPSVHCPFPIASDAPREGTGEEAVSSATQPEADASKGEAKAESGAEPPRSAVDPASTNAALVDPAAAMDFDAGVSIGDLLEDLDSVTPPDAAGIKECANVCNSPAQGCARLSCQPCCWLCLGHVICIADPPPEP